MALNVKIDLKNCYPIKAGADNYHFSFDTALKNDQSTSVAIEISKQCHPLLPNVHNLCFGPLIDNGQIDDKARLDHADHSKLFSTILSTSFSFLKVI